MLHLGARLHAGRASLRAAPIAFSSSTRRFIASPAQSGEVIKAALGAPSTSSSSSSLHVARHAASSSRAMLLLTSSAAASMSRGLGSSSVPALAPRRTYSTAPNQQQVFQSFATPFMHFIQILSRVARIIVVSTLSIVILGGLAYEGAHQYVEYVAMKASKPSDGAEEYGWTTEIEEEGWGREAGTDSRLSSKGRHAVRSAWISAVWGGGVSPYHLFSGPGAPGNSPRSSGGGPQGSDTGLYAEDGMAQAQGFLDLALREAERAGIRLPDVAATRAGVASASTSTTDAIDPTALALEWRLASVRERLGQEGALAASIAGYVRIFDALTTLPVARSDGGAPAYAKTETIIRLATRLGNLETEAGQREEGERWLGIAKQLAEEKVFGVPLLGSDSASQASPIPRSTLTAASPVGVRAAVATLLSLSSAYASLRSSQPTWRHSLEKALNVQAATLRLLDEATEGIAARTSSSATVGGELHSLWLAYNSAVTKVHLAETSYALDRASGVGGIRGSVSGALSRVGLATERKPEYARSKTLLVEADAAALEVFEALRSTSSVSGSKKKGGSKASAGLELDEKWSKAEDLSVFAQRLMRDSKRLRDEVKAMLPVLDAK